MQPIEVYELVVGYIYRVYVIEHVDYIELVEEIEIWVP